MRTRRPAGALVLTGVLALIAAVGALTAVALAYAREARLDGAAPAENARLVAAARAGCAPKEEWGHVHAEGHRGRVWIRVEPAPEHADRPHRYLVVWGPWATESWLDFAGQDDASREVYLLHTKLNQGTWPLSVRVDLPACVLFGVRLPPGQHLVSLDGPWRYQPAAEWLQQTVLR